MYVKNTYKLPLGSKFQILTILKQTTFLQNLLTDSNTCRIVGEVFWRLWVKYGVLSFSQFHTTISVSHFKILFFHVAFLSCKPTDVAQCKIRTAYYEEAIEAMGFHFRTWRFKTGSKYTTEPYRDAEWIQFTVSYLIHQILLLSSCLHLIPSSDPFLSEKSENEKY